MSRIIHPKPFLAYKFAELSDKAKQYACDKYNADDVTLFTDCYVSILESFGFSDIKIFYSLGYCQSDFASFDAHWQYKAGWKKAHIAEYGDTCKYTTYFNAIQAIMKKYFYDFELTVKERHNSPDMEYECLNNVFKYRYQPISIKHETELLQIIRNIAKQIYSDLLADYEYTTSIESFAETCECNDYEFTESGVMI